jgi:hypothetical protein
VARPIVRLETRVARTGRAEPHVPRPGSGRALDGRYSPAIGPALLYADQGRYAEALAEVEALLPLEEKVRGAEHPNTLISRFVSILIVHHLARQEEACEALRTLLPRMTASLPVNHQRLKQARELWAH